MQFKIQLLSKKFKLCLHFRETIKKSTIFLKQVLFVTK